MRHFLCLALPIATLACGVGMAPGKAGLVTAPAGLYATGSHLIGTLSAAVPIAAIAVAADDYSFAAESAQVTSRVWLHRRKGPTGFG